MSFTVLPAIDVTKGHLGAYRSEGPAPVAAFDGDPVSAARAFVSAGARWLHVVDMDLAFTGELRNDDVVRAIRAALPDVRMQASGGVRDEAVASALLDAGADRVVVGSAAFADADLAIRLVGRLEDRAVVGIEVEDGRIRGRGIARVDLDLMVTLGWLRTAGAGMLLVTAVARVGEEAGPDLALIRRVVRAGLPVLAAGGIASLEDLRAVRDAGAVGAVVGSAALDGTMDLASAVRWAEA